MSSTSAIPVVFARLAARLLLANPTPQPQLNRVITDHTEDARTADIPFAIIRFAEGATNTIGQYAVNRSLRHDYDLEILVVIGEAQTPVDEVHNRAKYWPVEIVRALLTDIQLAGTSPAIAVDHIGENITWQFQRITWPDGAELFALRFIVRITQKFEVTPPS